MSLPYSLAERIQALRGQIGQLLRERSRVDRELQEALAMLEHYLAVWEAESAGLRPRQSRGPEPPSQPGETAPPAARESTSGSARGRRSVYQLALAALEGQTAALHSNEITELVRRAYPEAAASYADLPRQIGVALVRGVQRGVLERAGPNIFRRLPSPGPNHD